MEPRETSKGEMEKPEGKEQGDPDDDDDDYDNETGKRVATQESEKESAEETRFVREGGEVSSSQQDEQLGGQGEEQVLGAGEGGEEPKILARPTALRTNKLSEMSGVSTLGPSSPDAAAASGKDLGYDSHMPSLESSRVKVMSACVNCRRSRVKCDKLLPCARCRRLDLECVPQLRGRGRPPIFRPPQTSESGEAEESSHGGDTAPTDSVSAGKRQKRTTPRHTSTVDVSMQGQSSSPPGPVAKVARKAGPEQAQESIGAGFGQGIGTMSAGTVSAGPMKESEISDPTSLMLSLFEALIVRMNINMNAAMAFVRCLAFIAKANRSTHLEQVAVYMSKRIGIDVISSLETAAATEQTLGGVAPSIPEILQWIPPRFVLRNEWNTVDAGYMERTTYKGRTTYFCGDLFRVLFFHENTQNRTAQETSKEGAEQEPNNVIFTRSDPLMSIFETDDARQLFQSIVEVSLTGGFPGTVIRLVLRFRRKNVPESYGLGLVYLHSFQSSDGTLRHTCLRILPMPNAPKYYSSLLLGCTLESYTFSLQPRPMHQQAEQQTVQEQPRQAQQVLAPQFAAFLQPEVLAALARQQQMQQQLSTPNPHIAYLHAQLQLQARAAQQAAAQQQQHAGFSALGTDTRSFPQLSPEMIRQYLLQQSDKEESSRESGEQPGTSSSGPSHKQ